MAKPLSIEWVRTDRLGDVLCSLPSLWRLRQSLSSARIFARIDPGLHPVLSPLLEEWGVELTDDHRPPDAVVFLNGEPALQWMAWRRGVATRVGALSKWYSFLFLNAGLRQKRSQAERHEGEYAEALVDHLVRRVGESPWQGECPRFVLPPNSEAGERVRSAVAGLGLSSSFRILHPGMGGSAVNLSPSAWVRLVRALQERGPLLLSEGPADRAVVERILKEVSIPVLRGRSLVELAEAFRLAEGVVAPSTGPLHLAHWVGTPTLGLYPPVLSQHLRRWAPRGGGGKSTVLAPEVSCPAKRRCLGDSCPEHPCMDRPFWKDLLSAGQGVFLGKGESHG